MKKEKYKKFVEEILTLSDEELKERIVQLKNKLKSDTCPDCGGSGYNPYPNHDTSYPICHNPVHSKQ